MQWLERRTRLAHWSRASRRRPSARSTSRESSDIEPYRLTLALGQAAEQRGVTLRTGEVTAVHVDGGHVDGVSIATGAGRAERVACDTVVVAMGPWTARASEWFGVPLPVHPLKGQIIRLQAPGAPYALSIGHLGNYAMTKPSDGLVWCGTTEEQVPTSTSPARPRRATRIIESTLRMLPALERRGTRAADGLPASGHGGRTAVIVLGAGP